MPVACAGVCGTCETYSAGTYGQWQMLRVPGPLSMATPLEKATWLPDRAGAAPVRLTLPAPGSQSASQVMMAEWSSLSLTVIHHGSLPLERELEFSGMKGDF